MGYIYKNTKKNEKYIFQTSIVISTIKVLFLNSFTNCYSVFRNSAFCFEIPIIYANFAM